MVEVRLQDINIINSPTGSGKTTAIIEYIKANKQLKFMFITPYLAEVDRLVKETGFFEPQATDDKSKSQAILPLLHEGKNIVCTHQLFMRFDDYHRELIAKQGYELIVDEVPENLLEVISDPRRVNKKDSDILDKITNRDLRLLLQDDLIEIDDKGLIVWKNNEQFEDDYSGIFDKFKNTIRLKEIYQVNKALISCAKADNFYCFNNITFLTYRYKNSMLDFYLRFYGFDNYNIYKHIELVDGVYKIVDGLKLEYPKGLKRIKLYEGRYNDFTKDDKTVNLSKAFFESAMKKTKNEEYLKELKACSSNYVRNVLKGDYRRLLWTTIDKYKEKFKSRYLKVEYNKNGNIIESFKSCNYKASNEFIDRTAIAYICEINLNPNIIHFLEQYDIRITQDVKDDFTLSIFLQFLWRSNIRDPKSQEIIDVYVPSPRLRRLFAEWLDAGLQNS